MGDSEQWNIDDNGYYLTDYKYTAPRTSPVVIDESLLSDDINPISHIVKFDQPSNIKINYSIGMMYAGPGLSPTVGLYYDYKANNGSNYTRQSLPIDNLGEANQINSVTSNTITLTQREISLENVTELTIWTSGRPVLWVDYIQIEILE